MDAKDIKRRVELLEGQRKVVEEQWTTIREYVMPYRGQFFKEQTFETAVEWRENRQVFDSTAINACNILASSLHGAVTNPAIQWFDFAFRDPKLRENKAALNWAHESAEVTFQTLRDSNFNLEINESYLELCGFGTSCFTKEVEEVNGQFDDFVFSGVPLVETYFDQDHRGKVLNFYRKMRWSARMIVDKFGRDKVPEKIRIKADGNSGSDMDTTVIFCVYKRQLGVQPDITRVAAPLNRPYGYKYVCYDSGEEIGDEGGYYTMPAYIMRWRRTADSIWGNSPAMIALPDILTLNELVELILNSLEKVVDPAIVTTERGLLSQLDLGASGVNVVRAMGEMEAFESRARFDVAELNREKLQASINRIFYVDQLQMKESPSMTATEVQVRYELMQRLLGPTLGRLESDTLDPLVMSTMADLMRYRKLPEVPQAILEAGDPRLLIRYTGPMARAQKMDQVASLERFAAGVAQLAEVQPEVLDVPDWDGMVKEMSYLLQVNPSVIRDQATINRDRKGRQQQQARMAEAQVTEQEGRAEEAVNKGGVVPINK